MALVRQAQLVVDQTVVLVVLVFQVVTAGPQLLMAAAAVGLREIRQVQTAVAAVVAAVLAMRQERQILAAVVAAGLPLVRLVGQV